MTVPQFIASMLLFGFLCYTLYKVIAWGVAAGVESAISHATSQITHAINHSQMSKVDIDRITTAISYVTSAVEKIRV